MDLAPLAYIDPGSGTILLQVLIASMLGGVTLFWHRIKKLLGFGPKDGNPKDPKDGGGTKSGDVP